MSKWNDWGKVKRVAGGVKDTAMGPLEGLWEKFIHSRLVRMLGGGIIFIAMGAQVACANAQPYNGPAETAPLPADVTSDPIGVLIPTNTESKSTDTATPSVEVPQIDPTPAAYPLSGAVQESFEKGEYAQGMDTAAKWVAIWAEIGILQEQNIGGSGNSLSPVPLVGRARVVCVDTKGKGEYAGKVLCPGLDLVKGGLRAVPTSGSWDRNADGPLFVTLASSEELVTKGTGTDLVYQIVNKYTGAALRYIDQKTGQYVEGEYQVPGGETQVESGTVYLDTEYNLDGKVAISAENSAAFYSYMADAFWRINKDYFAKLGATSSIDAQKYMQENILPAGYEIFSDDSTVGGAAFILHQSSVPVDMREIRIKLVDYDQFIKDPDSFGKKYITSAYFNPEDPGSFGSVFVGLALIPEENADYSSLVLEVVQGKVNEGIKAGFPDMSGNFDQGKLDLLNMYLNAVIYTLRSLDYSQPTDLLENDASFNPTKGYAESFRDPKQSLKIFTSVYFSSIIDNLKNDTLTDLPPSILVLQGN